jgi:hypothetical protein
MIALDAYSKSPSYVNSVFDTWIYVNAPMFIVRTDNHFTRYTHRKAIKIDKGVNFSIYNVTNEPIAVKVLKDTFDTLQHTPIFLDGNLDKISIIFTPFRGASNRRQAIFNKFKEYYESIGYKVLTTDTDHDFFNRSAARNTAAMVSPKQVVAILDADFFIDKDVLDASVAEAAQYNGVIKPSYCAVHHQSNYSIDDISKVDVKERLLEIKNKEEFSKEAVERHLQNRESYFFSSSEGQDLTNYMGELGYQGFAFIQRTVFWLGQDETFVEYGNEDSTYLECVRRVLDVPVKYLSYTPSFSLPHERYDQWNETSFHKAITLYNTRNTEALLDLLKRNAYYGHYGKFTHL